MFFFHLFGASKFRPNNSSQPLRRHAAGCDGCDIFCNLRRHGAGMTGDGLEILAIKMVQWGWLLTPLNNPYYNRSQPIGVSING